MRKIQGIKIKNFIKIKESFIHRKNMKRVLLGKIKGLTFGGRVNVGEVDQE